MGKKVTADQLASMNIDESIAKDLSSRINRFIEDIGPAECWQKVSKDILKPDDPFELHWFLYNRIYSDWDESKGPRPAWIADKQTVEESNIAGLLKDLGLGGGYFRGHGRVDDTMNLGGIKVSSTEIERALNSIEGVNETAAIAISAPGGGMSRLVVYTVLTLGTNIEKEMLQKTMQKTIKQNLNPLFKVHDVVLVDSLPRTASNKIMRRKLRSQYKL